jgi:hypothetical protein
MDITVNDARTTIFNENGKSHHQSKTNKSAKQFTDLKEKIKAVAILEENMC